MKVGTSSKLSTVINNNLLTLYLLQIHVMMKPKYKAKNTRIKTKYQQNTIRRSERLKNKETVITRPKSVKETTKRLKRHSGIVRSTENNERKGRSSTDNKDENKKQNITRVRETKAKRRGRKLTVGRQSKKVTNEPVGKDKSSKRETIKCASTSQMPGNRKDEGGPAESHPENIRCKHVSTFTTERHFYADANLIRFCDAVFIDDNHILVGDDGQLSAQSGFRVCCLRLDGTQVAEILLNARPWTVLALSPTKAVVSLRFTNSRGLAWLSIDIERGIMKCKKRVRMEKDVFGIAYDTCNEIFVVSHHLQKFLSVLNRNGETIGHIPVASSDSLVRCMFVGKDIMYLSRSNYIKVVDMEGTEKSNIESTNFTSICDFKLDSTGNLYVVNYGNPGNVCLFDREGNFIKTLLKENQLRGIGLNSRENMLVATHEQFISIYELQT